ncbi:vWA domain-containing protein [Desulfosudis oleivorans]|uniref:Metallopeptidase domain-containing protein n=1 Tax=Desulfosudis oleivorans (strain DSM 6200 / JCM 39069 / Hxd3) TaxID=96561 RepID=A8ZZQ2_DESOH|nr:VWA-like domain-containing protein [Desulfosudis oleivorans]ABW68924.1 conserved hypothetical protein [Desulfosudis oleivorans Hxd3]
MTGTSVIDKWDDVLSQLWRQSRFASYFYQAVSLVGSENVPTLALAVSSRRFVLFYNQPFVLNTPADHLIGLLIHEMLHIVLNHAHRGRSGQNVHFRNLAQDMVINSYLKGHARTFFSRKDEGARAFLALPPGLPEIPAAFGKRVGRTEIFDVTWEAVYLWLLARHQDRGERHGENRPAAGPLPGAEPWESGNRDPDKALPPEGIQFVDGNGAPLPTGIHLFSTENAHQQARAGAERILGFVRNHDECRGERLYSDLSRLIRQPVPARDLKWKKTVRSIADRMCRTSRWDYSFARPNRRFFDAGIYAPGRYLKNRPLITIVVDVSGSMTAHPGELEAAFGAVEELTSDFQVNLLCIDQDLFVPRQHEAARPVNGESGHYLYQKGDWRHIKTGSRGATFFAPLFNVYMKNRTGALVVITDGEIYDLNALAPYSPTLWVISGNRRQFFNPPFGSVMDITETS